VLSRLIYHSSNHLGAFDGPLAAELNDILDVSNANNQRDGITGALVFDAHWFIQGNPRPLRLDCRGNQTVDASCRTAAAADLRLEPLRGDALGAMRA
jgi:hypothetical protein